MKPEGGLKTHLKHVSKVKHVVAFGGSRQHVLAYLAVHGQRARCYLILTSLDIDGEVIDGEIHSQMGLEEEMVELGPYFKHDPACTPLERRGVCSHGGLMAFSPLAYRVHLKQMANTVGAATGENSGWSESGE